MNSVPEKRTPCEIDAAIYVRSGSTFAEPTFIENNVQPME